MRRLSAATERAMARVDRGENMHQAALKEEIAYTTIWRACKQRREDKKKLSKRR